MIEEIYKDHWLFPNIKLLGKAPVLGTDILQYLIPGHIRTLRPYFLPTPQCQDNYDMKGDLGWGLLMEFPGHK